MLKLLGSVLVSAAGAFVCLGWRRETRRVTALLWQLSAALEAMADEIRLEQTPVFRLLDKTARSYEAGGFFRKVGLLGREAGLAAAWHMAAEELPLPQQARQSLGEAAGMLAGDEEQVCRGLNRAASALRKEHRRRQERAADAERKSAALCLSGAAMIIILLI